MSRPADGGRVHFALGLGANQLPALPAAGSEPGPGAHRPSAHHPTALRPTASGLPAPDPALRHHLRLALDRLAAALGPLRVASLYRTRPISPLPQPDFLNTAATGTTSVPPEEILRLAKQLEAEAGRDPGAERWGPRPLDVDLLLYGDIVSHDPHLTLPHPRLHQRAFVLVPLAEIAPGMRVPPDGRTVAELLAALRKVGGIDGVERIQQG